MMKQPQLVLYLVIIIIIICNYNDWYVYHFVLIDRLFDFLEMIDRAISTVKLFRISLFLVFSITKSSMNRYDVESVY